MTSRSTITAPTRLITHTISEEYNIAEEDDNHGTTNDPNYNLGNCTLKGCGKQVVP